jgi:hypothetical protein
VQQLLILMRAIAAVLLCAGLPSWVFAQAGESSVAIAALPQDLSPWGMFLHADTIVKAVMICLAVASLVTWTVWVAKSIELFGARAAVRRGLRILAGSTTIAQAHEKLRSSKGPVAQLIQAAANEDPALGQFARRRFEGTHRLAIGTHRNGGRAKDFARNRHPRHDWRHGPLSQVTKSSIASSVLIFERPPPPLNGEAIASPLNNPSKPNVTQTAFSVIEISPTSL